MSEKFVLIVDDDKDIQSSIKMILELHGYNVSCVSNGQEALDSFKQGLLPSVILLDLMMPVMDGFEFMKVINKDLDLLKIPIIVMTAARNKTQEIKDHITLLKPFDVKALLKAIGEQYQIS